MITCTEAHHLDHVHQHGPNCGHTAIRHDGHVDYLHDGHLHHMHGDHVDEHVIAVGATNPVHCTPEIRCSGHQHGPKCGHEAVPHGDHIDYLVNGQLHHPAWRSLRRPRVRAVGLTLAPWSSPSRSESSFHVERLAARPSARELGVEHTATGDIGRDSSFNVFNAKMQRS